MLFCAPVTTLDTFRNTAKVSTTLGRERIQACVEGILFVKLRYIARPAMYVSDPQIQYCNKKTPVNALQVDSKKKREKTHTHIHTHPKKEKKKLAVADGGVNPKNSSTPPRCPNKIRPLLVYLFDRILLNRLQLWRTYRLRRSHAVPPQVLFDHTVFLDEIHYHLRVALNVERAFDNLPVKN